MSLPEPADTSTGGTLVFVYGPPAVGKLTVAREVARQTGFRVLHNHLTIDAVTSVFEWGTPSFFRLVDEFRTSLVETAATEGVDLVLTFAYAPPGDDRAVHGYVDAYNGHGGRVLFVQLRASESELVRRAVDPSRHAHGKLTDTDVLVDVLARYDFGQAVPYEPNLLVDTTTISPEDAAATIVSHYGLGQLGS